MTLINGTTPQKTNGLSDRETTLIKAFLQGAVYVWCQTKGTDQFAANDLVGGCNRNWEGTPLQPLYDKHRKAGKDEGDAYDQAGKDLGWILLEVLHEDKRTFTQINNHVNHYEWDGVYEPK